MYCLALPACPPPLPPNAHTQYNALATVLQGCAHELGGVLRTEEGGRWRGNLTILIMLTKVRVRFACLGLGSIKCFPWLGLNEGGVELDQRRSPRRGRPRNVALSDLHTHACHPVTRRHTPT